MRKTDFNLGWNLTVGSRRDRRPTVTVDLPNDYISTLPRAEGNPGGGSVGFFASAEATYEKDITLCEDHSPVTLLELDGAYEKAEVTVNNDLVFQHPYGYTGAVCDLSPALKPGKNHIRIHTSAYQPASRWYTGGGLFRVAALHEAGPVYIHPWGVFVTTPEVEHLRAKVDFSCEITSNTDTAGVVGVTVFSPDGVPAAAGKTECALHAGVTTVPLCVEVQWPKVWDTQSPCLYTARVAVETAAGCDEHTLTFGIRKIEMDAKNGFRLNGKPMKLRGGCIHHDSGFLGSAAFPRAEERKIELLREAGFNAIRTAHNPPSTALLDACDRLGMLVLEESFDCWRVGKNTMDYHMNFEKWWDYDTTAMVKRDRNHPSVYCWSIGNEIMEFDGASNGVYWGAQQADLVRSIDPTRPVTSGINMACGRPRDYFDNMDYTRLAYEMAHSTGVYDGEDRWGNATEGNIANLDVAGYNYMHSRYAADREKYPDRVIQGTETMPFYAYENWQAVRDNPNVIGDFVWVAYDNLGEAGMGKVTWSKGAPTGSIWGASWPWMSCWQGDLDLCGNRRAISYYRNVVWGLDKDVHLFTRHPSLTDMELYGNGWHWDEVTANWTYGAEWVGKDVLATAYCDADEVEFRLNGCAVARVAPEQMIARARVPYAAGVLEAVAYRAGEEISRDAIRTAGKPAGIRISIDRPVLFADGMDLAYVRAQIVDEEGIPVLEDGREIAASVSGAGSLAGLGSGNPKTDENFGTGRRRTFCGSVTAAVRASREKGKIELAFAAQGLPASIASLSAE